MGKNYGFPLASSCYRCILAIARGEERERDPIMISITNYMDFTLGLVIGWIAGQLTLIAIFAIIGYRR